MLCCKENYNTIFKLKHIGFFIYWIFVYFWLVFELPATCPLEQASATACVSMIAPRALLTIRTPFLHFAILSLSNNPLSHTNQNSH